MSKLDDVVSKYGGLPVPVYLGKVRKQKCAECGRPGAENHYTIGKLEGQTVGFVACDNVCAGFLFADVLDSADDFQL